MTARRAAPSIGNSDGGPIIGKLRQVNLALTGTGIAAFGLLLSILLFAPGRFDALATDFAVSEVSSRLDASLTDLIGEPGKTGALPDAAMEHLPLALRDRLNSLERLSAPETEALVREFLADACKLGCESRSIAPPPDLSPVFVRLRTDLASAQERLHDFVLSEYDRVLSEVRRDIGIFASATFALFLTAFLLGMFKDRASAHLLPISLLLSASTLLMAGWYVHQDWLLTVVFSDYWGYSYPIFAGLLAGSLIDIAFFRARITSFIINAVLSIVGSAASVLPC